MPAPTTISVRSTIVDETRFLCPSCGADRTALVFEGRRWIRVGWLPVVPLGRDGRRAVCATCRVEHPLDALTTLTNAALAALLPEVRRQLAVMIVATGDRTDRALRTQAVHHIRTVEPTYDQNRLDLDLAETDHLQGPAVVAPLATALALEGKERLLVDLAGLALATHTITAAQRWLLGSLGAALGLTDLHVTGIVASVAASAEPPADDPADHRDRS